MSFVASIVPVGPVRSAAIACALASMLGCWVGPAGPLVAKLSLTNADVARLHEIDGPRHGVGPEPVDVLGLITDHVAGLGQEGVGVRELALREEVGEDPDDVVAELALVPVHARIERVAAAGELGRDEAALVGVVEFCVGGVDVGDVGELGVPEGAHVGFVLLEGAGRLEGFARWARGRTAPKRSLTVA